MVIEMEGCRIGPVKIIGDIRRCNREALFGKILCTYFLYTFCSTDAMISSRHISKVRTIWIEMHKKIFIHR